MGYINEKKVIMVRIPTYLDLDTVYPVGSVYISVNGTSPASLFGGTWQRINSAFLYATSVDEALGQTGGNATHTHSAGELRARIKNNSGYLVLKTNNEINSWLPDTKIGINSEETYSGDNIVQSTAVEGTTASGDNMPPYIKVAIWKRTA